MKLVIVESPAKAKTIAKYLGEGYYVDASGGHVRDLPVKKLGVDLKNNYEPIYEITEGKNETIDRLMKKASKAEQVYLATDPDREGEAISWHLSNALKLDGNLKNRIMFNEISKNAVQKALEKPDYINMNLVNAQQARRVLDRLVGYKVSPVLCKKIQPKLSAGRVQSAALKIIVDREREIKAFVPEEYWTITALLEKAGEQPSFKALLATADGKKIKISDKTQCDEILKNIGNNPFAVSSVKKTVTNSSPYPPFTTSTMQQDAGNKLKFTSKTTMSLAQQLYEGVEIDGEHIALVTYIRTDSVRISADAQNAAREYIKEKFGSKYVPEKPNFYATKKAAQDAHEAIRPINLAVTPESLKGKIQPNMQKLYALIYTRFLASQAAKAVYDSVSVIIDCDKYGFKANGRTVVFDGYTRIYGEHKNTDDEDENAKLPSLTVGDSLINKGITPEQKFTKAPARYTEASLIKTMEENGIGRPSTFSTILSTLYSRTYVEKDGKSLMPTELGFTVTEYLEKYFADIVDVDFTAGMETKLDDIEEKSADWRNIVDEFYKPLEEKINSAKTSEIVMLPDEKIDQKCEKCGASMVLKMGRFGKYLACSNTECDFKKSLKKAAPVVMTDVLCDKCGAPMVERMSKYGKFLACSNYPTCKNTKTVNEKAGVCPDCGADLIKRMSKYGKPFYGCSNYPKCKFISWDKPVDKKCPDCGGGMVLKEYKNGAKYKCVNKDCGHTEDANES